MKLGFTIALFTIFSTATVFCQPKKGEFINGAIGIGFTASNEAIDVISSGFYMEGEYVFALKSWIGIRPYAGIILTSKEINADDIPSDFYVKANAFLFGTKVRIAAPIPWVAPYLEMGMGGSIGSFKTYTPGYQLEKNGLLFHVPVSLGLAIGRHNEFEIAFKYYYHSSMEQFSGAAAIGLSFPIEKKV
jgi:hypothetical protein